jgi:deoxycytidine triphosphate deaminase
LDDGVYEIIMEVIITIGPDEAGYIITRSTLNRNGLFITSGLYDSGYSGVMAGALHVSGGPASIKKGTRVGQFLLFRAESIKQYDGDYGVDSDHDQEYDKGANVAAASQMVYYDRGVQMEFNLKGDLVPVEEGNLYGN